MKIAIQYFFTNNCETFMAEYDFTINNGINTLNAITSSPLS